LTLDGDFALPLTVKTVFYRVAQEALNNAAKHSEANQVNVTLSGDPEQVTLTVRDDGQGFDLDHEDQAGHFGLRIMRERAEQISAHLDIHSQSGQGTQIRLSWSAETR
jgi:signal transduction histidine kinase